MNVHRVGQSRYGWRLEEGPRIHGRGCVAAAPVHQGGPITICDFDIVTATIV